MRATAITVVAAGSWRHVTHRIPVRHDPTWWSVVFPLGRYGVDGYYLGQADHLPIVQSVSADEGWVAQGAWVLAFPAMPLATVTLLT
jgi:tellurite resistance protein TehA-like permease